MNTELKLRPYQVEACEQILKAFETKTSVLYVLATGLGKTLIFANLINHFRKTGRIMVVAHREELITQAQNKIEDVTGCVGDVEMAGRWASNHELYKTDVVISTIQTQNASRGGRMTRFNPDEFSLLITDEAHHCVSDSWSAVIKHYSQNPKLKVLGCTATPDRFDEEALGQIFQAVAYEYDIKDGIEDGWLVPVEQYSKIIAGLDYSQIRTTAGDLNGQDLAAVLENEEIPHAFVDGIIEATGDRKTLIFAASVVQAEMMTEIFNRPNRKPDSAEFVCGTTQKDLRRDIVDRFAKDKFQYLVNVGCFTEGFDCPDIKVIAVARPTKSRSLYAQMIGRGTRVLTETDIDQFPTEELRRDAIFKSDKSFLTVLDFVGNSGRHKLICPADILGGNYSDDVVALANENATKHSNETKKPVNIATELQQAEREIAHRAAMRDDAEARNHLLLRAKFSTAKVNPFDVLDIDPVREQSWHKGRLPTKGQLAFLQEKCGVNTDGLSFTHAHQMINEIIRRRQEGQCTFKMAAQLKKNGFPPDLTFEQAGPIMKALALNHWRPLPEHTRQELLEIIEKKKAI